MGRVAVLFALLPFLVGAESPWMVATQGDVVPAESDEFPSPMQLDAPAPQLADPAALERIVTLLGPKEACDAVRLLTIQLRGVIARGTITGYQVRGAGWNQERYDKVMTVTVQVMAGDRVVARHKLTPVAVPAGGQRKSSEWEPMPLRSPLGGSTALRLRAWVQVRDNAW